jgi:Spy/CpxP family protein refolding chaperone
LRNKAFVTALLVVAVLALAAASGVHAADLPPQLTMPPEKLTDEFLRGLSSRVSLTPQETAAVRAILVEQTRKRQEIARGRLAANPGMAGMRALRDDMRALSQVTDARLAAVLPPEKMAAVCAYRDERRKAFRARAQAARRGS